MSARTAIQPRAIETREKLVAAAHELMVTRGYPATTVDEICNLAGASKGSFYHLFSSKEEIAIAAVDAYFDRSTQLLSNGAWREDPDPVGRALSYVDHAKRAGKQLWGGGCLLGSLVLDVRESNPELHERARNRLEQIAGAVTEVFRPVSEAAGGSPTAAELARSYVAIIEGAIVLYKADGNWRHIPEGLSTFRHYLEALSR